MVNNWNNKILFIYTRIKASRHIPQTQMWWKRHSGLGRSMPNPNCSVFPNVSRMHPRSKYGNVPISRNRFFQLRGVEIPVQQGMMRYHTNEFRFLERSPVNRPFLECDCFIQAVHNEYEDLCINGKIYLSKGICSDLSFFVHTRDISGNFKVLAHVSFLRSRLSKRRENWTSYQLSFA